MAIDYRKEVDSGYDRKVIVEGIILELLKKGMPPEIIKKDSNFNIRHNEMLHNLRKGYESKLEQVEDMYDTFYEEPSEGLGESYSEVVHIPNIPELYPMTEKEEKEKFTLRDKLNKEIEKAKLKESKQIVKKRESCINKIVKLKVKYPILETIIKMTEEMDIYISEGTLTSDIMDEIFKKYNFDKSKFTVYNLMYKKYEGYMAELAQLNSKIDQAERGIISNEEIERMTEQRDKLEEELIQRNIKLINYFIREEYKSLLVEQEELFDTCLIGMSACIRKFDVNKGCRFSTYACKGMDIEVKSNFKNLTGYSWDDYWNKKKIQMMLECTSKMLERTATVQDLVELGMLDISYDKASAYAGLISIHLDSYVYGDEYGTLKDQNLTTFEQYEEKDEFDNNRYANYATEADEIETGAEMLSLRENMAEILTTLTDRERIILVLRFGLDREQFLGVQTREYLKDYPNDGMTLKEVGKIFNLSPDRIRQIEAKALRKLRHPSREKRIREYKTM